MPENHLIYSVDRRVATIRFNRPDKLNALTPEMLSDFFKLVAHASADTDVRVILLTGTGRAFSAGLDLSLIGSGQSDEVVTDHGIDTQWADDIGPALKRFYSVGWHGLITSRKPTIAAINGSAFGWGFLLALHCDIRFAARSALCNATFARLGVPGEKNAAWLLTRLIGPARAADLLYTARRFDGVEAERLGVVNAVLDDDALMAHALEYARDLAVNSAPRSLAAMKAQIWTAIDDYYDSAFAESDREQDIADKTEDFREGVKSLIEKRTPDFRGI
ncbi:MAG: enoyl-CoA hydratase/isomerase family protein [Maricaulis sp.]|uniref:enoyl-CoA hydratase-related protein n=1 Tax=Maricaulis sp. TaxID=1486257 RepID=UPI001B00844E|nr:enoyl-CoA hydratase-related protein [Maricaulis sp.]MBO6696942.1 enoyl-CoA hydratase/isomerase family protein [Henriciella sp.]MBO6729081.1 enoyl-CoA hydratase/isomerase family protein [Maricaulis sp.]MBO6878355.1 enoyl-CoA hydratase/isomerase family protein [Maricaulis sp.]